jgi:hypothetical protein
MSQFENPELLKPGHEVTLEEVRALMGASTPHFAMQLRVRIKSLIKGLPAEHPARVAGEGEIARLDQIAIAGETRGHKPEDGLSTLPSLSVGDLQGDPPADLV